MITSLIPQKFRLYLFVLLPISVLMFPGTLYAAWGGWENLGGVIKEQPECVSWGPNRIDCFARGGGDHMYHRWWPCPSCDIATRSLTVSRYTATTLSNADVDGIFSSSSNVLQTNNGTGDVACAVALNRSGNIAVFTTGDGSIDTSAELSAIFGLAGNVKVVDDVNYCANQFNTSYIGCGQTPGSSFITERFTASQEGILWAHEYGHNTGLPHRDTSTNNVMYYSIGSNRTRINQTECNSYRSSAASTAATSTAESGPIGKVPVKEFVSNIYFDGLPLDKAATYAEKDASILLDMLKDPRQVRYHENIALTLGMIGDPRAVEPLIAFINKPVAAKESRPAYKGRVGAIVALGYLVNRNKSKKALSFLKESSTPESWKKRNIKGTSKTDEAKRRDLSKYAIIGLGLSGDPEAAKHLELLNDQTQKRAPADAAFLKNVKDLMSESMQLNKRISRDGLLKYYEKPTK